jgi:hypothetical protein
MPIIITANPTCAIEAPADFKLFFTFFNNFKQFWAVIDSKRWIKKNGQFFKTKIYQNLEIGTF